MIKTVSKTLLAVVLSITTVVAPVQADERTERIIAGAIILGILGAAISQDRQDTQPRVQERVITPLIPEARDRQLQPQFSRGLPAECLRSYHTRDGAVRLFDGGCLEHRYAGYRHLPLSCAVTIRNHGRFESGFRPQCLRAAGYRLAGH